MSGNLHSSGGPTCLCGFTISVPEVPLGGARVVPMSVCCGAALSFSQGPSPSLFLSCRPENWVRGPTWARDHDLFTGAAAFGLSVILDCTLVGCPPIKALGGCVVWTTFPPLCVPRPGRRQRSSWSLAPGSSVQPQGPCCRPWAAGMNGGVCPPSSSITRPGKPYLCCTVTSLCLAAGQ